MENQCVYVSGETQQQASVFDEGKKEMDRHKWILSEQAGHDVGDLAFHSWLKEHWWGFLRQRWVEHLEGKRFWVELDKNDFGFFKTHFQDQPTLLDRILDRVKAGQENLDIICWAVDWGVSTKPVLKILEALDINSRRLTWQNNSSANGKDATRS